MYAAAIARGADVWSGFFPQDLPDDNKFDVIVFNDVLEHLPEPQCVVEYCEQRLTPGRNLVSNIPCSRGTFYQLAQLLDRIRVTGPFERMWQLHFASPHISYFTPEQLDRLATRSGLQKAHRSTLPSINLRDPWTRLRNDRQSSIFFSTIIFVAVIMLIPVLRVLPADISLQIFRRPADRT